MRACVTSRGQDSTVRVYPAQRGHKKSCSVNPWWFICSKPNCWESCSPVLSTHNHWCEILTLVSGHLQLLINTLSWKAEKLDFLFKTSGREMLLLDISICQQPCQWHLFKTLIFFCRMRFFSWELFQQLAFRATGCTNRDSPCRFCNSDRQTEHFFFITLLVFIRLYSFSFNILCRSSFVPSRV